MPDYQTNYTQGSFEACSFENRHAKWPKFYCEGDSWFAYPPQLFQGNILKWLFNKKRVCVLSRATNGHTLESMAGAKQRLRLIKDFTKFDFDAILLSGGGNDFAGEGLFHLLRYWEPGMKAADVLREDLVDAKFTLLKYCLQEFIHQRNLLQPGVPIYTHEYDYPYPDGTPAGKNLGPLKTGPWLQPSLEQRGIPEGKRRAVITLLLRKHKEMVRSLEGSEFKVVRTQGLIKVQGLWANELHPNRSGFKKVAGRFSDKLSPQFPRVFKK